MRAIGLERLERSTGRILKQQDLRRDSDVRMRWHHQRILALDAAKSNATIALVLVLGAAMGAWQRRQQLVWYSC
ncbi:hypothetical protein SCHPADRAFT_900781 [Schizopora paradoxa]|uniref:Uncharacterized protein n=1 Tax=Schizopora paradoxa TaxID=27342 RepID=A0A0H2RYZ6_9AGAM|nr:hypothetical protein SCHPADRAFT_900781 [Schizopora paradoxa]